MVLTLHAPTLEDVEQVRGWRNQVREALRTPFLLTADQQAAFYHDVICDRRANSRWWSVYLGKKLIGFCGLVGIEWENGLAEISLIIDPQENAHGYGAETLKLLLDEGFGTLGLQTIYGECYHCNPSLAFWRRMIQLHDGYQTKLPRRKRWQGQLHDSLYFSFSR